MSTRGHQFKLFNRRFRLEYGKYSFSNRVVDEWNRLPDNVVTAEGLNSFKEQLDKYLSRIRGVEISIQLFTLLVCHWRSGGPAGSDQVIYQVIITHLLPRRLEAFSKTTACGEKAYAYTNPQQYNITVQLAFEGVKAEL